MDVLKEESGKVLWTLGGFMLGRGVPPGDVVSGDMKELLGILVLVFSLVSAAMGAQAEPSPGGSERLVAVASDIGAGRVLLSWRGPQTGPEAGFRVNREPAFAVGAVEVHGRTFLVDESGLGEFLYRVERTGDSAASPWVSVVVSSVLSEGAPDAGTLRGLVIGGDGWAELRPGEGSRTIYVSSTAGDDRHDGLSPERPKRTIKAGYAMLRDGDADWLLFRSGDVWEEGELWWSKSGRSPSERMVVGSYGEGPRPKWMTGKKSGITGNPNRRGAYHENLVFRDLHLVQHENDGAQGGGGFMLLNGWRDVLIENCRVEGYRVNLCFQAYIEGVRQSRIVVRRSVIVDALATNAAHAQGIFADGVDGLLIEENVLDRNGWGPEVPTANMFRHNIYIQGKVGDDKGCTGVVTRGNISARASATGFMQRPGGVVEGNLLLQNPIGIQFGYSGGPPAGGGVRGNVVIDGRDIGRGEPRAFGVWLTNVDEAAVEDNIIAHQRTGTHNAIAINVDGSHRGLVVKDNIVYDWADPQGDGASLTWHGAATGRILVEDNHFQQVAGGGLVGHSAEAGDRFWYRGNRYYSVRSGRDEFWSQTTYAQWVEQMGEEGSVFAPVSYADAGRTIERYMEGLGRAGGIEAFLMEAREQSRANWREEFSAAAVIRFVREGFRANEP
jgi:hypothetical protein